MKVGVLVLHEMLREPEEMLDKIKTMGFDNFQLASWNSKLWTSDEAKKLTRSCERNSVMINAFWCGWSGPAVWDFKHGPETLGLVPETYRYARSIEIRLGADFAHKLGVEDVITHVGFLPENPNDQRYRSLIPVLKDIAVHLKKNGQNFLFETGQETPVTLLRAIEDIDEDNVGVNLDPANLIIYGKANPVDAVRVLGSHIKGIHGKDAVYPVNGYELGAERPLGEGLVDYPKLFNALQEVGYDRIITIEKEISGEKQVADILKAKEIIQNLIS